MVNMVEYLFSQREEVGRKLARYIFEQGYSKKSFAQYVGISRPTLDKLLNGEINNMKMFEKYLRQIIQKLSIEIEELISYQANNDNAEKEVLLKYYRHEENSMNDEKTDELFSLLDNLLILCEIYYPQKEV